MMMDLYRIYIPEVKITYFLEKCKTRRRKTGGLIEEFLLLLFKLLLNRFRDGGFFVLRTADDVEDWEYKTD
jgi:hypothetical protein